MHVRIFFREVVRVLLKLMAPEETKLRKAHSLKRREYYTKVYLSAYIIKWYHWYLLHTTLQGPNHVWHTDGFDKLKPYGFAIHGCIDGYVW